MTLADMFQEGYERKSWVPPGRQILRLNDLGDVRVCPIYCKGDGAGRERALEFLARWHYLHQSPAVRAPNFTWVFGLLINGELVGIVCFNPPAAGVPAKYYGQGSSWGAGMIGISRTCCRDDDRAPFNSESFMVSAAIRMLPKLDHRFHTVIAQSDLSIVDPYQRTHTGVIYQGSNGWWAGYSRSTQWRGFLDPKTGARISRKNGGRNRSMAECPDGWIIEEGAPLTNFLWFPGKEEAAVRNQLTPATQVLIRQGVYPVWRHPSEVSRGTSRAYSLRDKVLRSAEIAA